MSALGRSILPSPLEHIVLAELSSARVTFLCEDSHSGALIPLFLPAAAAAAGGKRRGKRNLIMRTCF